MNGYTGIFDERDVTFEEWVWRYARAFGPLIHMREDGFDAAIRLPSVDKKKDSYYENALVEAKESLARFEKMTLSQAQAEVDAYYAKSQQEAKDGIAKKQALRSRVERVLQQCKDWAPPSLHHVEFKDSMIRELNGVLQHDCDTSYYDRQLAQPKSTPEEWRANHIQWNKEDVERYNKKIDEELKVNTGFARQWILDLNASVPTLIIKE